MAQLAVSLAGAGIGYAIGGPQGARIGYTAGSILGRMLFPGELPDEENKGARLGDLKVTASSYGQSIPKLYGAVRLGGNCTWSLPIEEVRTVQSTTSGGKGGPSQTTTDTSYNYFGTFAISFGEGVAEDVIRIWADGKLIFDKSDSGAITRKKGLIFRFYGGGEDQLPDSLEEADKGVGTTPAYRGQIRIVFDRLPLKDYGNRHPNIEAEIAMVSTPNYPYTRFTVPAELDYFGRTKNLGVSNGTRVLGSAYDSTRKRLYLPMIEDSSGTLGYDRTYLTRFDVPSMEVSATRTNDSMWTDIGETRVTDSTTNMLVPVAVDSYSDSVICVSAGSSDGAVLRVDGTSLKVTHSFGVGLSSLTAKTDLTGFYHTQSTGVIAFEGNPAASMVMFLCVNGLPPFDGTVIGILRPDDLEVVYFNASLRTDELGRQVIPCTSTAYTARTLFLAERNGIFSVYYMNTDHNAYYNATSEQSYGVEYGVLADITATEMNAATGIQHTITGLNINDNDARCPFGYDPDNDSLLGVRKWTTASGNVWYAMSIDATTGALNWVTYLPASGGPTGEQGWIGDLSKTQVVRLGIDENQWFVLDKFTGEILEEFDPASWLGPDGNEEGLYNAAIDYDFDAMIRVTQNVNQGGDPTTEGGLIYFNRASANATTLDDIVSDLCTEAGLAASDIDVSDLTDTQVKGYMVTQSNSSVRSAIEPLAQAYFFDAVESDYQLKFVDRGGASVLTLEQDDLGAISDNEYWLQSRVQEQEMPMRISVGYMDYEMDYQQGTQYAKRAANPFPVMYSKNEVTVALPIVLDDSEAKQIAEKQLFNTWVDRDGFSTVLSWEHLKLDPADIVTVNLDNGAVYEVRVSAINFGADMSMRIDSLAEDVANYTSTVLAENNFTASEIQDSSPLSYLKVHNVPLLSDLHDQGRLRSGVYVQAGPLITSSNWSGCVVYSSTDQLTWNPEVRILTPLTYGSVQGTFAAPADVFAVDTVSTLTIWPTTGASNLDSITYAQLLTGALNMAIVGSEVINFQNVTDNGDGSYTLDTFLRGRRGTDTAASSHTSSEYFYLVNDDNTEGFSIPLDNVGSPMYFKAVGSGQTIEEAILVTLTPSGEDLKPYAPVNAVRTDDDPSSGDITIAWDRRTRINGGGVGVLPLNEDSEEYEVDILASSGGAVVRTYDTLTSAECTYTAAHQATDSFAGGTLYCRIYQVSAQVGRGKSYEFELEAT